MPTALLLLAAALSAAENHAYPADMAAWPPAVREQQRKAAEALLARVREAVKRGDKRFRVPPGHYRFSRHGPKRFELRGVNDLAIDATGATFWFDGRYRIDSVLVHTCRNVSIRGLTVDYDPLPYAQGEIVGVDKPNRTVDMRIAPGFPLPDASWTRDSGKIKAVFYNRDGRMIDVRMDWVQSLESRGDRLFRVGFKFGWHFMPEYKSQVGVGDTLCLPDRSMRHSFVNADSQCVTLEDITVYACPHMAFTETGGAGGHVYRRCRVVRRPGTRRLMACNADVFHSVVVRRGPLIEQCEFSHAADDFVNIHGFLFMVYEQRSPTQVVVVNQYSDTCYGVGSALSFHALDDFAPLGEARVLRLEPVKDKAVCEAAKRMPADLRARKVRIRDFHPRLVYTFLVDLDRPVKAKQYDFVACGDRSGAGAVIRNNHFHDGFTRGVLLKCSDAKVEGNTFERTGMSAVAVSAERFWMEGPFASRVLIRNNTIVDSGAMFLSRNWNTAKLGAISVVNQAHVGLTRGEPCRDIRIVGNRIVRPSACAVALMNARECRIEGNTIEAPFSKRPVRLGAGLRVKDPLYAIYIAAAGDLVVRGNRVLAPSPYCKGDVGLGPGARKDTIRIDRP